MAGKRVSTYRHHKSTGQAVVTLDGKDVYLGIYGSPESRKEYAAKISEWQERTDAPPSNICIRDLTILYLKRCEGHYVKGDVPTSELHCVKLALKPLNRLYWNLPIAEFTPKMLANVRKCMLDAEYVRTSIDRDMRPVRRMFKWGVAEGLVPGNVFRNLETLQGLQAGRTDAKESEPVIPVPLDWVNAVRDYVCRPIWGMIQLQLATGMRPGEVRILRGCDLNMPGEIWE